MIKITKDQNKYLIEYIDHLNYLENEDYYGIEEREKLIKKKIADVKRKLQKLINKSKNSSGRKIEYLLKINRF